VPALVCRGEPQVVSHSSSPKAGRCGAPQQLHQCQTVDPRLGRRVLRPSNARLHRPWALCANSRGDRVGNALSAGCIRE
jgi:hypothetical protein